MDYQAIVDQLKSVSDENSLVDKVHELTEQLMSKQTYPITTQYRNYMLFSESSVEDRIIALSRHLDKGDKKPIAKWNEVGVMGAFRSQDNSDQTISHLLVGIPNMHSVYIVVMTNNKTNLKAFHTAIGVWTRHDFTTLGVPYSDKVNRVSDFLNVKDVLDVLDKVGKGEEVYKTEVPPQKTAESARERFIQKWGQGETKYVVKL